MAKSSLLSRIGDKSELDSRNLNIKNSVHPYFDNEQPSYVEPLPYTRPAYSVSNKVKLQKTVSKEKNSYSKFIFWILFTITIILLIIVIYGGLKIRGIIS